MKGSHKILLIFLVMCIVFFLPFIIFGDNGFMDLKRFERERDALIIKNSKIGLPLLQDLRTFKRLSKNDLEIIEQIARSELKMIGKNELILVPGKTMKQYGWEADAIAKNDESRLLSKDEMEELLNFDIKSFKFHEKLIK